MKWENKKTTKCKIRKKNTEIRLDFWYPTTVLFNMIVIDQFYNFF